ncbi:hypothetical protein ACWGJB_44680 [Streptomyces sp. NPDC054813]
MNSIVAVALAAFLIANGVAHFVRPDYVRRLVPSWLGRSRLLVAAGGVALIADSVLLLAPRSRAAGGCIAAAMISVFVVAHLDGLARVVAERPRRARGMASATVKVLLNFAYIGGPSLLRRRFEPGHQGLAEHSQNSHSSRPAEPELRCAVSLPVSA